MVLPTESETDMRFNYCACAISFMIDDWSGVDKDKLGKYVMTCMGY
jgi:geranylgeranyl transferase type-1 subunit beta